MTIKLILLFKMSYKELKEEESDTFTCLPYVELLVVMLVVAMICGTCIRVQDMWITERKYEVGYLRGSHGI